MVELRMLGTLELVGGDGTAIVSVLAQPRRVALLCYLAVAKPYGYHSRDTILSLFWRQGACARHTELHVCASRPTRIRVGCRRRFIGC
jgi:DNA-binding SARP family transcriptional activator